MLEHGVTPIACRNPLRQEFDFPCGNKSAANALGPGCFWFDWLGCSKDSAAISVLARDAIEVDGSKPLTVQSRGPRHSLDADNFILGEQPEHTGSECLWSAPANPNLWRNRQNRLRKITLRRLSALLIALVLFVSASAAQSSDVNRQLPFPVGSKTADASKRSDVDASRTAPSGSTPGGEVMRRVLSMLEQRASIAARIRHQMNYEDQHLYGTGSYWQKGRGQSLRVRLELKFAGLEASLIQVSNGRFLWSDRQLPIGRRVSLVDLRRLRAEAATSDERQAIDPGRAAWSPIEPELLAFHGGLPMLMGSLDKNFEFSRPQPMRLNYSPPLVKEAKSVRVLATVGRWRPDRLVQIAGKSESDPRMPPNPADLPERFPTDVLVLVGQENDFPYRVEYRRSFAEASGNLNADPSALYQLTAEPLVVLEFFDEEFDGNISESWFQYEQPAEIEVDDETSRLVDQIRKDRERLAKRSASSKK
jgi:hypothetical protein